MKIAIIGLGLIGASLLKALQGKGHELVAISKNQATVQKAIDQNLASEASLDYDSLRGADVIFIATPIDNVCETIEKLSRYSKQNAIIADLASVKEFVLDYVHSLETKLDFIGLHPMAGTENKGFDNATDDLFVGSKWAVVPSKFAKRESIDTLVKIIESVGAKPVFTDAKSHDKAVAMISHLPLVLAQGLFLGASDQLEKTLAASGFRDMTRLAMSNTDMARDMVKFNRKNIQESLLELDFTIKTLLKNYANTDIEKIAEQRRDMYTEDGKNKF